MTITMVLTTFYYELAVDTLVIFMITEIKVHFLPTFAANFIDILVNSQIDKLLPWRLTEFAAKIGNKAYFVETNMKYFSIVTKNYLILYLIA